MKKKLILYIWESQAFAMAGPGGWKLEGIVAPDSTICV